MLSRLVAMTTIRVGAIKLYPVYGLLGPGRGGCPCPGGGKVPGMTLARDNGFEVVF